MSCNHWKLQRTLLAAITLALLFCSWQTSLAQPSQLPQSSADAGSGGPGNVNQPRVEVAESVFNYGEVEEGETIRHDFKVRNSGLAELQISQVNPG
jgi:hypothetical protein